MAFPCNQFRGQEPGSNFEVDVYRAERLNDYPFFAKSTVNDEGTFIDLPRCSNPNPVNCLPTSTQCCEANNPVYDFLKAALPGELDWNFVKFLVGRDGRPIKRWNSQTNPLNAGLREAIEAALDQPGFNASNVPRPGAWKLPDPSAAIV